MTNPAQRLTEAIAAICPILGVSIGTPGDSSSCRINFDPSATVPQRAAAQSALDGYDWTQATQDAYDAQQQGRVIGVALARRKSANQAFSSNVFADVADMTFQLAPNSHYVFEFEGAYTAAAAGTSLVLSVNGPASPALCRFVGEIGESATVKRNDVGAAYDAPIAGQASTTATPRPFRIKGSISTGAVGGAFTLRARSSVNGSAVNILMGALGELAAAV